jgi:hypothetical protein
MKDDLKKYINLAYNLDDLIFKSLNYGNKEKLYESFISGQLLFEQANNDLSELDKLITQSITDTGTSAPYTDAPYTGLTATTLNQRQQSNLTINDKLRRPWGDPYIYYSATSGSFYAYKCGKDANKSILPCPQIKSTEWKDANKFKTDILKLVFNETSKNSNQQTPQTTSGTTNTTPEVTTDPTQQNQQINIEIKNKFRNLFYLTYSWFIANNDGGKILTNPTSPNYVFKFTQNNQLFASGANEEEVNLITHKYKDGGDLDVNLLTKTINNFLKKTINVNGVDYKLNPYTENAMFPASSIFKSDSTGYIGDTKTANLIQKSYYGIYKVE